MTYQENFKRTEILKKKKADGQKLTFAENNIIVMFEKEHKKRQAKQLKGLTAKK
jgi:hypothetical protein